MKKLKLLLLLFILTSACAFGQSKISLQKISHIDGNFNDIAVRGDRLYTLVDTSLKIYDINNPSSLKFLAGYDTKRKAEKIAVYKDYVYIADTEGGALFLSVADINDIYVKLSYNSKEHQNYGVVVKEDISYEADGTKGLNIVDISDPYNAFIISTFSNLSDARDIAIKDDYLYIADGKEGLKIVNISDIKNPYLIKDYDTSGFAFDIKIKDDIAYIADKNSLETIDISNPFEPFTLPNDYQDAAGAKGVDIKGDYLYLAKGDKGLDILKIKILLNEATKEDIEPFVKLLYRKILNREADKEGADFWTEALIKGNKSVGDIAIYFFNSKEFRERNLNDEDFIKTVYKTLLERDADKKGLNFWISKLQNNTSRLDIVKGFLYQDEFKKITAKYGIVI